MLFRWWRLAPHYYFSARLPVVASATQKSLAQCQHKERRITTNRENNAFLSTIDDPPGHDDDIRGDSDGRDPDRSPARQGKVIRAATALSDFPILPENRLHSSASRIPRRPQIATSPDGGADSTSSHPHTCSARAARTRFASRTSFSLISLRTPIAPDSRLARDHLWRRRNPDPSVPHAPLSRPQRFVVNISHGRSTILATLRRCQP